MQATCQGAPKPVTHTMSREQHARRSEPRLIQHPNSLVEAILPIDGLVFPLAIPIEDRIPKRVFPRCEAALGVVVLVTLEMICRRRIIISDRRRQPRW